MIRTVVILAENFRNSLSIRSSIDGKSLAFVLITHWTPSLVAFVNKEDDRDNRVYLIRRPDKTSRCDELCQFVHCKVWVLGNAGDFAG